MESTRNQRHFHVGERIPRINSLREHFAHPALDVSHIFDRHSRAVASPPVFKHATGGVGDIFKFHPPSPGVPPTPHSAITAPSITRTERTTSAEKSTCPGVSIKFIW